MNKIVREHYPVERLPEDLRALVPGAVHVTVEVTLESASPAEDTQAPLSRDDAVALMREMQRENVARGRSVTTEEAVQRIRQLRDEWDD